MATRSSCVSGIFWRSLGIVAGAVSLTAVLFGPAYLLDLRGVALVVYLAVPAVACVVAVAWCWQTGRFE